jgi:REP-associated tyrosine transposase
MPRAPRIQIAGGLYHVCVRGNRGEQIVLADGDRRVWLATLADAQERCGWSVYAYSLLGNHYHLLLRTPRPNLSEGMQYLGGAYATRFNVANGVRGHLQQGRYLSKLVTTDEYSLELIRYIALNAWRAGLCRRPEEWPWASYPALLGLAPAASFLTVDWTLRWFGDNGHPAREQLRAFIDATPPAVRPSERPALAAVLTSAGRETMRAAREYGYTVAEIAAYLRISPATAYRQLRA